MRFLKERGVCDCHSHVFGPFDRYPLSPRRTFEPPEAPIEQLEDIWNSLGIDRAVLVQGSPHGNDHGALLAALARSPQTRRGVALLSRDVADEQLSELHHGGIRAVRFNWIGHLLGTDSLSESLRLAHAGELLARVSPLGWHAEIHIDITDLDLLTRLPVPAGMPVVIDHMARMDKAAADFPSQIRRLLTFLERDWVWLKLSGADRLAIRDDDLKATVEPMRQLLQAVPNRCIWGLDWPHVNLSRQRSELELTELLLDVAGDESTLQNVLIHNPARLYGFDSYA